MAKRLSVHGAHFWCAAAGMSELSWGNQAFNRYLFRITCIQTLHCFRNARSHRYGYVYEVG
jgi:hypothetical protein